MRVGARPNLSVNVPVYCWKYSVGDRLRGVWLTDEEQLESIISTSLESLTAEKGSQLSMISKGESLQIY